MRNNRGKDQIGRLKCNHMRGCALHGGVADAKDGTPAGTARGATKFANSAGDIFCSGHCAKVRCTYVQPGQGRTPRAPGRLSHSCRIVHAQTLGGASASNPMTVAAASASLGSPALVRPRCASAAFGCIPRASTRETALEKRRVQCPTQREDAREQLRRGRDGESREKDWKRPRRSEKAAEEEMRGRGAHSIMPKGGCARWRSGWRTDVATPTSWRRGREISIWSRPISRVRRPWAPLSLREPRISDLISPGLSWTLDPTSQARSKLTSPYSETRCRWRS